MSIIKTNHFANSKSGRAICVFLALIIFNLQSCSVYKARETSMQEVSGMEQVINNLNIYHFYLHSGDISYALVGPSFKEDGMLSGKPVEVAYEKPDSTWNKKQKKEYWKSHRYDVNIYLNDSGQITEGAETVIQPEVIDHMTITTVDRERQVGKAALIVLISLGGLVTAFLIVLLTTVVAKASSDGVNSSFEESSGASGSGSGTSGSGSSGG